jgi:membrane-bound metal-dependent hydrolase YbcI (DUF457 family)
MPALRKKATTDMDPITHGLTGALIGKALFAAGPPGAGARPFAGFHPAQGKPAASFAGRPDANEGGRGRAAIWICVLAAMFPDVDVFFEPFVPMEMATIELHRGVTHSLVCLPAFTALMATLTWWWVRWRTARLSPGRQDAGGTKWWGLAGMWAAGIASHIVLDLATSWGTMVWAPLSNARVTWDWVFIIDFVLTGIVVLPQVMAWVYARRPGAMARATVAWTTLVLAVWGVQALATRVNVPFSAWTVPVVAVALAAVFFLPAAIPVTRRNSARQKKDDAEAQSTPRDAEETTEWGFAVSRAAWCRAGLLALAGYYGLCAGAHRMALGEVEAFARERGLQVESLGALPMPPAMTSWSGLVRTPEGVYVSRFRVPENPGPEFELVADRRPPEPYRSAVARLEEVQTYLWFARFPVVRYREERGRNVVEFFDLRFFPRDASAPAPFQYRVVMNERGELLEQGWVED